MLVIAQFLLPGRIGKVLFAPIEGLRTDPGLDFGQRNFFINADILLDLFVKICDVAAEDSLLVLVESLQLSEAAQLAIGTIVSKHLNLKNLYWFNF